MKLFQYWDTGDPPDDVSACIESVRALNPEFRHRLFDRDRAAWFIGKHLGARQREAFFSLAVPAMQADYFRLCAMWSRGGAWVDADSRALKPLLTLLDGAAGLLSMWDGRLQNHVIVSAGARDPFLGAALELATRNIEERRNGAAYSITGPEVLNLIWSEVDPVGGHEKPHLRRRDDAPRSAGGAAVAALFPGAGAALLNFKREHDWVVNQWLEENEGAAYKATERDWRRWRGPIYVDQPRLASIA